MPEWVDFSGTEAGATLNYSDRLQVFLAMIGDAFTIGLLFFLGFLALAGGVLTIMRYWLVEGTLDGTVALGALGGLLALTAAAVKTASPALIFIWIAVVIGGTLLVPFIASQSEKGALNQLHEADLAKYRRAVEANPQFAAAWREMAEVYMRLNRYDDAIAAYKEAIRLNPPDVQKLRRRLNAALEYRAGMPRAATMTCDQCGQETPKAKRCLHCGAPLELTFLDWILQRENLMEILRPTAVITAGAVATLAVFAALPIAVKAIVIAIAAIVGALLLWRIVQDI
jgi:tetratricopeptide (TPR) repeat protein